MKSKAEQYSEHSSQMNFEFASSSDTGRARVSTLGTLNLDVPRGYDGIKAEDALALGKWLLEMFSCESIPPTKETKEFVVTETELINLVQRASSAKIGEDYIRWKEWIAVTRRHTF